MSTCAKSPDGRHCWHGYTGPWYGLYPPSPVCCWCGEPESAAHGPHRPHGSGGATFTGDWCAGGSGKAP